MGSLTGKILLLVLAALAAGTTVRDKALRLKIAGGACAAFVLYALFDADLEVGQALYLYVLIFFLPYSIGTTLQRRFGKKD